MEKIVTLRVGKCNSKGVTLLELLLVIFIISLTTVFVFPYIFSYKNTKKEMKTVASLLRYAYETSLATKNPCVLKTDLHNKTISVACQSERKEYEINSLMAIQTTSRGLIKEGVVIITFSLGKEESVTIHLFDGNNISKIYLNQLSGRVKIIDS
ncbi:MAG TPA: hypothetical protein HPP56_05830 [Nitrospirae bacterium]|nr:hypothetical protein [Nitrospirota bacterium]